MDFHYDYVANENNIRKKRFDHRNGSPYNEYSYDDIDRLTGVTYLNSQTEGFVMDDLGNRTGIQTLRGGGTDDYSVDSLTNRYTAIDASPLAYDDAGNLTRDKDGYVYRYDYENRIVEIRSSADVLIAQMDYDTQGRRIRVYDAAAGTETLYYYSDQWQVLAEYTPSGTQQAYYVYGNYIDEVLFRHVIPAQAGIQDFYYLHDHLYSPVALLNPAGTVVERNEYDAYGKASILSPNYEPRTASSYANAYYFTGREVDYFDNRSLPLQYNRHRYLSQYMGRWCSHDPLGYIDELNLYVYVQNNPLHLFDSFGLFAYKIDGPVPGNLQDFDGSWNTAGWFAKRWFRGQLDVWEGQARYIALGWELLGYNESASLLKHYLGRTGHPVIISYQKMLKDSNDAKETFKSELLKAQSEAERLAKMDGVSLKITQVAASGAAVEDHPDWEDALHSYQIWGRGYVTKRGCCYTMNWSAHIHDVYDFSLNGKLARFAELNRFDRAKYFKVKGRHDISISWIKGSRFSADRGIDFLINYGAFYECK